MISVTYCITCSGLNATDSNVCNGNGDCVSVDNCECHNGYTGTDCDILPITPIITYHNNIPLPLTVVQDLYYKTNHKDHLTCIDLIPYIQQNVSTSTEDIITYDGSNYSCINESKIMISNITAFRDYLLFTQTECYEAINASISDPVVTMDDFAQCTTASNFSSNLSNSTILYESSVDGNVRVRIYPIHVSNAVALETDVYSTIQHALVNCGQLNIFNVTCRHQYALTPPRDLFSLNITEPIAPYRIQLMNVNQTFTIQKRRTVGNETERIKITILEGTYPETISLLSNTKKHIIIDGIDKSLVNIHGMNQTIELTSNSGDQLTIEVRNVRFTGTELITLKPLTSGVSRVIFENNEIN